MTNLLITGGSGLLGHALQSLRPDAAFSSTVDCDLTDLCRARRLFDSLRPKQVLHCAAKVGGVQSNAAQNAEFSIINSQINANVLAAAQEAGARSLTALLSSCSFLPNQDGVADEDDLHRGLPYDGNLGYGYSKRMLDIQIKLMARQYGLAYSSLTPATMYGPYDNWDLQGGHVVASLIRKCHQAKVDKTRFEVWGSGRAVRQFVYVGDVAHILLLSLEKYHSPETVIVAPEAHCSIRELAEEVARAMEFRGEIFFDASKPEGQPVKVLRSRRFNQRFPGFKFTPLSDGLRLTVEWYLRLASKREAVA